VIKSPAQRKQGDQKDQKTKQHRNLHESGFSLSGKRNCNGDGDENGDDNVNIDYDFDDDPKEQKRKQDKNLNESG